VVATTNTFLHGKDNTFRSSNPKITERFNQIPCKKHGTDKYAKGFNTWSHLVSMIFCQFADCVSLREISNGLHSANGNLNHLGIPRAPSKSNLAYQNEHRSCAFFRDCYYAQDSTIIKDGIDEVCERVYGEKQK